MVRKRKRNSDDREGGQGILGKHRYRKMKTKEEKKKRRENFKKNEKSEIRKCCFQGCRMPRIL